MSKEVGEDYASSLADLTVNSKPLITMLTMLAEENIEHAGVIVQAVETHLEKVRPEIKLPVLYLVDSIIKNVGGAYTQKFSQIIVNLFTKTFKQVDEKTRSQMFKLRDTWHNIFPASKLYQLDVKVNIIDPAWPIQAQPQQPNIHVNPHFIKKQQPGPSTSAIHVPKKELVEEEKMKSILAQKEKELLLLQHKKKELELEQTIRQLAENKKILDSSGHFVGSSVSPLTSFGSGSVPGQASLSLEAQRTSAKQRLGPPVTAKPSTAPRIAPVSGPLAASRRQDPRLARHNPPAPPIISQNVAVPAHTITSAPTLVAPAPPILNPQMMPIMPNLFDIKPLDRSEKIPKRKNFVTIDVKPDPPKDVSKLRKSPEPRNRRDPRLERRGRNKDVDFRKNIEPDKRDEKVPDKPLSKPKDKDVPKAMHKDVSVFPVTDVKKIYELPPIPKLSRKQNPSLSENSKVEEDEAPPAMKKKKEQPKSRLDRKPKKTFSEKKQKENEKKSNYEIKPKLRERARSDSPEKPTNHQKEELYCPEKKPRSKERGVSSSPDKRSKLKEREKEKHFQKQIENKETNNKDMDIDVQKSEENEPVTFKELKNFHKEHYRRNKEQSESPEKDIDNDGTKEQVILSAEKDTSNLPDIVVGNKDIDLRLLHPAPIATKRPSTETVETKSSKKSKTEKFDILFGDEDVDLRKLPQLEETNALVTPSPPKFNSDDSSPIVESISMQTKSPLSSPKEKAWSEVKTDKHTPDSPDDKDKGPSHLDLVRAKLAEATKGKDRLGRPLLYSKSQEDSPRTEDTDMRNHQKADLEPDNDKETLRTIMHQAEEQFKEGSINRTQYNELVIQILQLNEKQKLKEAKQRESLERSKRKLQRLARKELVSSDEEPLSPKEKSPKHKQNYGDIDERVMPVETMHDMPLPEPPMMPMMDSDLRLPAMDGVLPPLDPMTMPPMPPCMDMMNPMMRVPGPPMFGPFPPMWNADFKGPRNRMRGPMPPFFRGRMPFDQIPPMPPMGPPPLPGILQGEFPGEPYVRCESPPPMGSVTKSLPPPDFRILEYINRDPMKTIEIDGQPREIRFYGDTAVIMLNWDDPREICFLSGSRRITFEDKDSVVIAFNDEYKTVTMDDQTFKIRYGAPTRELYIDDRWYECLFGGPPTDIIIEDKIRRIRMEGPRPQVNIGKDKRTDLVAGRINLIVDAVKMHSVFLDGKPQKFDIQGNPLTLRFVDSLQTVLINEFPFQVEFGGLPKPIYIGKRKHFIRFSVLPKNIKPGQVKISGMEGVTPDAVMPVLPDPLLKAPVQNLPLPPETVISEALEPDSESNHAEGLDMLASVMPSSMAPASQFSGYSLADPLQFAKTGQIPGLDTPVDETPTNTPFMGSINVSDLFAKLVATGIVKPNPNEKNEEIIEIDKDDAEKEETKEKVVEKEPIKIPEKEAVKEIEKAPPVKKMEQDKKEDKITIKRVDLLKPETLRVKQGGLVARLYGGMQCSGCGARFPPEQTVRYSQHLDWHFRQNRRERDSARRAHSRHWHYDLADWVQYEEVEDLEEREKSWFESQASGAKLGEADPTAEGAEAQEALTVPAGAPRDQHCALCGDKFDQFYNQDKEEWQLRRAVRHQDNNYHPLCFEEYKASQVKEVEEPDVTEVKEDESLIEIKEDDRDIEEIASQSDNESVVEVLDNEESHQDIQEPVEIPDEMEEDGDEDDVVFKPEPVEEVHVRDDSDTDDETTELRRQRDRDHTLALAALKIKQEPIDDEPVLTAEEEAIKAPVETIQATVMSSIDGNVQLAVSQPTPSLPMGGIRINITKPVQASNMDSDDDSSRTLDNIPEDEPLPPGEEVLELEYKLKSNLEGIEFSKQPPIKKGNELSGLCSIM